ncbi:SprT-like domain-containing protein [Galbitalea soli]|uniref:SprT family zinc-dependent metalloprotease n=1 Tax=Galbitalea soli TaxID=1268042 RepID=A0A7C9TQ32_9MICO|nr:SprT-like domain-containing protein [Galbitalea soli]NEM91157.1 SprT family zinc-dependent metalloprotease [Galbitalea soli]NYJ29845.1 putative SprT family Zn-dependent metalloprotease [Galbitalea soli]
MADLNRVRTWADALIALYLDPAVWTFGFDNAKARAGLCDYSRHRISVSRYLAAKYDDDEIHQILLHEVAHAIAGPRTGHGAKWKRIGAEIGYVGARLHDGDPVDELAPWVGVCPSGHRFYRYRKPTRALACARCSRRFDPAHLIDWTHRTVDPAVRRAARAS